MTEAPSLIAETRSLFALSPMRQGKGAYNAAPMGKSGSVSTPALPWPLAPILVALGWTGMLVCGSAAGRLGLRPALLISEMGLAMPALFALALLPGTWGDALALRRLSGKIALVSLAAGGAFWAASLGLFELQYAVWRPPPGYLEAFQRLHEMLRPSGPFDALISVGAIAVAPAVFEEILFRGAVLPALLRPLGAAGAILVSAALFGLIHLDLTTPGAAFYRVPFAFGVGLGLGILRVRTGALLPSILAHALLNTITFVAEPLAENPSAGLPDPRPLLGFALLAGGIAAALLAIKRIDSAQASP